MEAPTNNLKPAPQPLTTDWLSAHVGCKQEPVAEVEETPLSAEEEGVNSQVSQMCVRRASGEASQYIIKRVAVGPALQVAMLQRWYERECCFYKDISCQGPCALGSASATTPDIAEDAEGVPALKVPRCLCAQWLPEHPSLVLILELLGAPSWTRAEPEQGCSPAEALAAVEALAKFHGHFYKHGSRLASLRWLPTMPVHLEFAPMVQDYYAGVWVSSREKWQEIMPPAIASMCDLLCESYATLTRQLSQSPRTLLHGDFRLENLRFMKQGGSLPTVAAFDWQFVSQGRGAYDFAYFVALALPPEARRLQEDELKKSYLDTLALSEAPSFEKAAATFDLDVCTALLLIIASFVVGAATAPPQTLPMHERALLWLSTAALDWNAGRVLPTQAAVGVAPAALASAVLS